MRYKKFDPGNIHDRMNCFKVFSFFFIVLLAFVSCADTSNLSNDIELRNTIRSRRAIENGEEINSSDEYEESIDLIEHQALPIITLDQYRASLKVNLLIFLIFYVGKNNHGSRMIFSLSLVLNALVYFRPSFDIPRSNVQTVSVDRWLLTPFSWLTEILLLLSSEENLSFSDSHVSYKQFILSLVLAWQIAYYFSAFTPQNNNLNRT